jgi:hypothetical protein
LLKYMSARSREVNVTVAEADRSDDMAEEYVRVSEALKLVTPFSGNKREILTFISNVNTAFEVINPIHEDRLYKFILTRISGEPRIAIAHRNLDKWTELREFLRNTYIEKRTLDFHANQLFKAKQGRSENISEWIQKIQRIRANRLHTRRACGHLNIIRQITKYLLHTGIAL